MKSNNTAQTWIEFKSWSYRLQELTEIEFMVDWEFTPIDPGRLSGPPEDCYPPEGGELVTCVVEIDGERIENGEGWLIERIGQNSFDLEKERAEIKASERATADYYDRGDYLYESRRDEKLVKGIDK